jgi:ATP-dependent DNA helicase RecG
MPISVSRLSDCDVNKLLAKQEGHFFDAKSKLIKPADLTKTMSAFANADGGEIYVGIDEADSNLFWNGFIRAEEANGHIQAFESFFPLGEYFSYDFLSNEKHSGLILRCEIAKTPDAKKASNGHLYLRRGAQNLPQNLPEQIRRVELNKGISSFEDELLRDDISSLIESEAFALLLNSCQPQSLPTGFESND